MTTQTTNTFGNLTITMTRIEDKTSVIKFIEVARFNGEYYELLSQNDADYRKAIIMNLNHENA